MQPGPVLPKARKAISIAVLRGHFHGREKSGLLLLSQNGLCGDRPGSEACPVCPSSPSPAVNQPFMSRIHAGELGNVNHLLHPGQRHLCSRSPAVSGIVLPEICLSSGEDLLRQPLTSRTAPCHFYFVCTGKNTPTAQVRCGRLCHHTAALPDRLPFQVPSS